MLTWHARTCSDPTASGPGSATAPAATVARYPWTAMEPGAPGVTVMYLAGAGPRRARSL